MITLIMKNVNEWIILHFYMMTVCIIEVPVLCYPCLPDTFSPVFVRSLPGTVLENRMVGNSGLQAGAGCLLSWYDLGLIQLCREETFIWGNKRINQIYSVGTVSNNNDMKWSLLTWDVNMNRLWVFICTPAGVCAAVLLSHWSDGQVGHLNTEMWVIFNAHLEEKTHNNDHLQDDYQWSTLCLRLRNIKEVGQFLDKHNKKV